MSRWRHWLYHPVNAVSQSLRWRYDKHINAQLPHLIGTEAFSPELFRLACERYNVREIVVAGEYGPMQGAANDHFIMPEYMGTGSYDRERTRFLRTKLSGGGSFLDIGANVGMYTVALAANPSVQCIAFEPEPGNFRALETNVRRNCIHQNVICQRVAVMETAGEVTFELSRDNTGDHRVRAVSIAPSLQGEDEREVITVRADRLERLLMGIELRTPLIAKIDVQGAELSVIRSSGAVLDSIDLMILEFWPYGLRRMGATVDALLAILGDHFPFAGYSPWDKGLPSEIAPFDVVAQKARLVDPTDADSFAELFLVRRQPIDFYRDRFGDGAGGYRP